MTVPSACRNIIAITKDTSLTALLTGYCLGKSTHLTPLQSLDEFGDLACKSLYKLIVIDSRCYLCPQTSEDAGIWRCLEKYDGRQVIIIYRQKKPYIPMRFSHFHYVEERELISALDDYLGKFLDNDKSEERRIRERRQCEDRRASSLPFNNNAAKRPAATFHPIVKMGEFEVNHLTKTVFKQGRDLQLTRKEFELFSLLMTERAEIYSAEAIVDQLWPNTSRASKSDLYQYIHTLRKKLEHNPCRPECLLTVKGVGYQLRL